MNKSYDAYRFSRIAYIAEAAFEYFISILVTGAFLASLLTRTGISDSLTGVISAISSLACSAQLIAVFCIRTDKPVKKWVTILSLINQLLFVSLYLIPGINVPSSVKTVLFIAMIGISYLLQNILTPSKFNWLMSLVAPDKRGSFTAAKERVSLFGGMIFSLGMGRLVDIFTDRGETETAFAICGLTLFVLALIHLGTLIAAKEPCLRSAAVPSKRLGFLDTLRVTLGNGDFRKIVALDIFWQVILCTTTSYYGVYQIGELGFSMTYVTFLSVLYGIVRIAVSGFFGRYADRRGWAEMLSIVFLIAALAFGINCFTVPSNGKVLYAVYYVVYAVSMAGINAGVMNITFDYVKPEYRTSALGIKSAIGGICGFVASIIGGCVVSAVQARGNQLFGFTIYAQQLLSLFSCVCAVGLSFYVRSVVMKLKRL